MHSSLLARQSLNICENGMQSMLDDVADCMPLLSLSSCPIQTRFARLQMGPDHTLT